MKDPLFLAALAVVAWYYLFRPTEKDLSLVEVRDADGNLLYSKPTAYVGSTLVGLRSPSVSSTSAISYFSNTVLPGPRLGGGPSST